MFRGERVTGKRLSWASAFYLLYVGALLCDGAWLRGANMNLGVHVTWWV